MQYRHKHLLEVRSFLRKEFSYRHWDFSVPHGYGNESYFAHSEGSYYFVKLGIPFANYQAMASIGLTPPVIASGYLEDGISVMVQPFLEGRKPSRMDYRFYLDQVAGMISKMHHSDVVRSVLPQARSELYSLLGLEVLTRLQHRWEKFKQQVPSEAAWVDEKMACLAEQLRSLLGAGAISSHNDICNANWLITPDDRIYLVDLDSMSLDDPAADLGAILWWYYPHELRKRFLQFAGYQHDESLHNRMRLRMAIHCLHIILPRDHSFDQFKPDRFIDGLTDFRAVIEGKENPQGYD
jgi:thiamine kinase-like enzyme